MEDQATEALGAGRGPSRAQQKYKERVWNQQKGGDEDETDALSPDLRESCSGEVRGPSVGAMTSISESMHFGVLGGS